MVREAIGRGHGWIPPGVAVISDVDPEMRSILPIRPCTRSGFAAAAISSQKRSQDNGSLCLALPYKHAVFVRLSQMVRKYHLDYIKP